MHHVKTVLLVCSFTLLNSLLVMAQVDNQFEIEGVIIYTETDSIPQDVIIIPRSYEDLTDTTFGYWIYFQAMRWTQNDLYNIIKQSHSLDVEIKGVINPKVGFIGPGIVKSKLTYGKIIFDKGVSKRMQLREDSNLFELELISGGRIYYIIYKEIPQEFGLPKSFQPIEW